MEAWQWREGGLEKEVSFEIAPDVRCRAWIGNGRCLASVKDRVGLSTLRVTDGQTQALLASWPRPGGWYLSYIGSSRSGKYVALAMEEESTQPLDDFAFDKPRLRIGILDNEQLQLNWGATIRADTRAEWNVRTVVPSDDGAYVAVAGWKNGMAMVDMKAGELLWQKRPPTEVSSTYAAFGPTNNVVYAGGGEGCVYEMAVADGSVIKRWFASTTGKSEYGHRISALAVSPDGNYLAAGTGPAGLVFLISTKTGKTVATLNHGNSTVALVQFSPDSKRLATFAPGSLKVWKIIPPAP